MSVLNPRPQKLSGPTLLHHLVRDDISDDTPALDYLNENGERHCTTYRQLHGASDDLARRLRTLRDRSGHPPTERFIVPIFIGQCPELYITQLAILKAGGAAAGLTAAARLGLAGAQDASPAASPVTSAPSAASQLQVSGPVEIER